MKKTNESLALQNESKHTEENQNNSDSFDKFRIHRVKQTPFHIIKRGRKYNWEIAIGNNIATHKKFKYKWEAIMYIKLKPWELIWTAINIIVNKNYNDKPTNHES